MKYIFIRRDKHNNEEKAHGSDFLEGQYDFPSFTKDDKVKLAEFEKWKLDLENKANEECKALYPDSFVFLERLDTYLYIYIKENNA